MMMRLMVYSGLAVSTCVVGLMVWRASSRASSRHAIDSISKAGGAPTSSYTASASSIGGAPDRSQGFVPDRSQGFVPDRSQGFVPDRSQGFVPDRKMPVGFSRMPPTTSVPPSAAPSHTPTALPPPPHGSGTSSMSGSLSGPGSSGDGAALLGEAGPAAFATATAFVGNWLSEMQAAAAQWFPKDKQ
jgi:hypothetical protein